MIELSYQVTEDEFVEAGFKLAERKGTVRVLKTSTVLTIAFDLLVGTYILYLSLIMQSIRLGLFGVCILGFAVAFPFLRRARLRQALRKVLKKNYQGAPFMHFQVQARMDDSGISTQYLNGSSVNTWEGHQSSFETDDLILVMQTTTHMRVFPKRAFTANQLTEFRQLLAAHNLSPKP